MRREHSRILHVKLPNLNIAAITRQHILSISLGLLCMILSQPIPLPIEHLVSGTDTLNREPISGRTSPHSRIETNALHRVTGLFGFILGGILLVFVGGRIRGKARHENRMRI
ncbi:hypothetical protein BDV28DRAFT_131049 [Aspergillus coremiiformis]|uniref:Uncharacterized protein n=1 Tax=Aspergillus coremiiformis TaxID=138285 RepID=A0A5N6Z9V0_9EURO|nr:hypothetical protein BDV28DRAFT_131049 [Aspergillus coremiiformis]